MKRPNQHHHEQQQRDPESALLDEIELERQWADEERDRLNCELEDIRVAQLKADWDYSKPESE